MAKLNEVRLIARTLNDIPRIVETCHQVADALIETDEQWSRTNQLFSWFFPTEYERARHNVTETCIFVQRQLKDLRKRTSSPDAIRAGAKVSNILECCAECPAANRSNLSNKKAFCCLAQARLGEGTKEGFRFRLNNKGQILETG